MLLSAKKRFATSKRLQEASSFINRSDNCEIFWPTHGGRDPRAGMIVLKISVYL